MFGNGKDAKKLLQSFSKFAKAVEESETAEAKVRKAKNQMISECVKAITSALTPQPIDKKTLRKIYANVAAAPVQ